MKKTSKVRLKGDIYTVRYQTREEVEVAIKKIGDLQRELLRQATLQNDELAAVTERFAPILQELEEKIKPMQSAVQAWCESHRDELTNKGKTKTGSFNTGEVQWRQRPPSIVIRGKDKVIEALKRLGLVQFIRTKEDVNKDAMLDAPDIAATVSGVTVKQGEEDFVIKPFEQEVK
ncbi:host-nuclease inhibitor protein Gam [Pasteurellaceae bacterium HPA106]|uniref:host-nuclease inhibitor Gam family protein n=1 Tax=Spirabiliibacterium pneumoniae TaxID=221400 RepID=UPI001AACA800|nr:host-nuclease inhibitor Gam family protein [Spirabiliibacterium pneumoniae]MBE2896763.1 host-nuclease inhibitor protein Gam [Spirabiliibacterium pneumoniae]